MSAELAPIPEKQTGIKLISRQNSELIPRGALTHRSASWQAEWLCTEIVARKVCVTGLAGSDRKSVQKQAPVGGENKPPPEGVVAGSPRVGSWVPQGR